MTVGAVKFNGSAGEATAASVNRPCCAMCCPAALACSLRWFFI